MPERGGWKNVNDTENIKQFATVQWHLYCNEACSTGFVFETNEREDPCGMQNCWERIWKILT
jgi:hypothetical protein